MPEVPILGEATTEDVEEKLEASAGAPEPVTTDCMFWVYLDPAGSGQWLVGVDPEKIPQRARRQAQRHDFLYACSIILANVQAGITAETSHLLQQQLMQQVAAQAQAQRILQEVQQGASVQNGMGNRQVRRHGR